MGHHGLRPGVPVHVRQHVIDHQRAGRTLRLSRRTPPGPAHAIQTMRRPLHMVGAAVGPQLQQAVGLLRKECGTGSQLRVRLGIGQHLGQMLLILGVEAQAGRDDGG